MLNYVARYSLRAARQGGREMVSDSTLYRFEACSDGEAQLIAEARIGDLRERFAIMYAGLEVSLDSRSAQGNV